MKKRKPQRRKPFVTPAGPSTAAEREAAFAASAAKVAAGEDARGFAAGFFRDYYQGLSKVPRNQIERWLVQRLQALARTAPPVPPPRSVANVRCIDCAHCPSIALPPSRKCAVTGQPQRGNSLWRSCPSWQWANAHTLPAAPAADEVQTAPPPQPLPIRAIRARLRREGLIGHVRRLQDLDGGRRLIQLRATCPPGAVEDIYVIVGLRLAGAPPARG